MKKILLSGLVLASLLTSQKSFSQTSCALNPDFSDPNPTKIVDGGGPGGGYEAGDTYLFENVLPAINAEIRVESMVGVVIYDLDNNSTNSQRFQPFLGSNSSVNEGYIQFAIVFKKASDNSIIPFSQLRASAFDVDGEAFPFSLREAIQMANASIAFNSPSNLVDVGTTSTSGITWRKILGENLMYGGLSNDPAISFNAQFDPSSIIRIRLGYMASQLLSAGLDYSIEFGCFVEAENVPLPLTLLNFNGSYANNKSILNWSTQSEVNVDRFEIERSSDANNFAKIGSVSAKGSNGTNDYQLTEDMTNIAGGIFYYRLKSVDKDGKFTYSKVVALRRDTKLFNQISITPNPIINGNGVIKITATSIGTADIKIVDFAGRIIMLQKVNLFEGVNVLPINVARQLSAGVYSIQLFKGGEVLNSKFVVGR